MLILCIIIPKEKYVIKVKTGVKHSKKPGKDNWAKQSTVSFTELVMARNMPGLTDTKN